MLFGEDDGVVSSRGRSEHDQAGSFRVTLSAGFQVTRVVPTRGELAELENTAYRGPTVSARRDLSRSRIGVGCADDASRRCLQPAVRRPARRRSGDPRAVAAVSRSRRDRRRADARLPETWSRTDNIRWRTRSPASAGRRRSSPGTRSFSRRSSGRRPVNRPSQVSTSAANGRRRPTSIAGSCWPSTSRAAPFAWQRDVHRGAPPQSRHLKNSYASETPTTDGERVYALVRQPRLFAYTMDGTPAWQRRRPARRRATAGARPRPRCCTTAASTCSTTTRRMRR